MSTRILISFSILTATILVPATTISCLDNCNSLLNGLFASILPHLRSTLFKAPGRIFTKLITPVQNLPIAFRTIKNKTQTLPLASKPWTSLTCMTLSPASLSILHYVLATLTPWLSLKHRWASYFKIFAHIDFFD